MDSDSTRVSYLIMAAALVVSLAALGVLWGGHFFSPVSACLCAIVTFLLTAIGLGIACGIGALVLAGGRDAGRGGQPDVAR